MKQQRTGHFSKYEQKNNFNKLASHVSSSSCRLNVLDVPLYGLLDGNIQRRKLELRQVLSKKRNHFLTGEIIKVMIPK